MDRKIGFFVALVLFGFATICNAVTLQITWQANTEVDLKGYNIYIDQAEPIKVGLIMEYQTAVDMEEGQIITVQLTAFDLSGNESEKSEMATCIYDTIPGILTDVAINFPQVNWLKSLVTDLEGYRVYINGDLVADLGLVTTYQIEGVPVEGQIYSVQIVAYDLTGNESEKSEAVVYTYDTIPEAPTEVKLTFFDKVIAWIRSFFHVG